MTTLALLLLLVQDGADLKQAAHMFALTMTYLQEKLMD